MMSYFVLPVAGRPCTSAPMASVESPAGSRFVRIIDEACVIANLTTSTSPRIGSVALDCEAHA